MGNFSNGRRHAASRSSTSSRASRNRTLASNATTELSGTSGWINTCLQQSRRCRTTPQTGYNDDRPNMALGGEREVEYEDLQFVTTATHYHADYVEPRWSKSLSRLTKIGHHIFYL